MALVQGQADMTPRIYTFIPYCHRDEGVPVVQRRNGPLTPGVDIGAAYHRHMRLIPNGAWGLLLDHDIAFLTPSWLSLCEEAISSYPDTGLFTCMSTRLPNRSGHTDWNLCGPVNCHNMQELKPFGLARENQYHTSIRDITTAKLRGGTAAISGFFMLISKTVWDRVIAIKDELHGYDHLDKRIHDLVLLAGYRIRLIESLVVYHWLRDIRLLEKTQ